MADRPLPRVVLTWPREDVELFVEMSGKRLSDGVSPGLADQQAMLELAKERKARGE